MALASPASLCHLTTPPACFPALPLCPAPLTSLSPAANDFATYMDAQDAMDALYRDQDEWTRRSIIYTASSGFFSSDRTIEQYAREIWNVKPHPQP